MTKGRAWGKPLRHGTGMRPSRPAALADKFRRKS